MDTSVLIDFFRKTKKENTFLYLLTKKYDNFAVSVITEFEIYAGSNESQIEFWNQFFQNVQIIPFDSFSNQSAVSIFKELKPKGQLIEIPDLFIAAKAKAHGYKVATLNLKHFERVEGLEIVKIVE